VLGRQGISKQSFMILTDHKKVDGLIFNTASYLLFIIIHISLFRVRGVFGHIVFLSQLKVQLGTYNSLGLYGVYSI